MIDQEGEGEGMHALMPITTRNSSSGTFGTLFLPVENSEALVFFYLKLQVG